MEIESTLINGEGEESGVSLGLSNKKAVHNDDRWDGPNIKRCRTQHPRPCLLR